MDIWRTHTHTRAFSSASPAIVVFENCARTRTKEMQWERPKRHRRSDFVCVPCARMSVNVSTTVNGGSSRRRNSESLRTEVLCQFQLDVRNVWMVFCAWTKCTRLHSFMILVVVKMFIACRTLCRWFSTSESWISSISTFIHSKMKDNSAHQRELIESTKI